MLKCLIHACFALALSAGLVSAQTIPGGTDPAFRSAVADWLTGEDDRAALQALSELAQADNAAAQILLARLERAPHLTAHVTEGMARAERIALLRMPGGLSGRSWMTAAAETVPLAQAFLDNAGQNTRVESLRFLFEAGEPAAAIRSLPGALSYGTEDLVQIMQDLDAMPDEARVLIASHAANELYWQSGAAIQITNPVSERRPPELALIWRPVYPAEWAANPEARELALAHSINIESLTPLRTFCSAECGDQLNACMATGAALLNAFAATLPFASPSEALIPTTDYWQSPRIDTDVRRLLNSIADPEEQSGFVAMNACFMQAASN
ncbi:hypothetical protein [Gymnodinialimonas hymeniacidonis]|uniref:hypothetical protein n=1 Tax=Gymnodinialimonas hymeniacidonis TaxID=3126508 RepID=UPI0034C64501